MKTIYLHVGIPKTATSYIQKFLTANYKELLNHDVRYPSDSKKEYFYAEQHATLFSSITGEKNPFLPNELNCGERAYANLISEIDNCKQSKIVLSSEFFYTFCIKPWHFRKIRDAFKNYNVKVIIYLRRQDLFYMSVFQQATKTGESESASVSHALRTPIIKYYKLIKRWGFYFGKDNLSIKIFEKEQWINNNIIDDFLNILGIQRTDRFQEITPENESISLEKVLFIRKLNKHLSRIDDHDAENNSWEDQTLRNKIINMDDILTKGKSNQLLSIDDRKTIVEHFDFGNSQIAKQYLGNSNGRLFSEVTDESPPLDKTSAGLDEEKVYYAVVQILREYLSIEKSYAMLIKAIGQSRKKILKFDVKKDYLKIKNSNIFNTEYYLEKYTDVKSANIDPIRHYIEYGAYELRNPNRYFDTKEYYIKHPAIIIDNVNPLVHYLDNQNNI